MAGRAKADIIVSLKEEIDRLKKQHKIDLKAQKEEVIKKIRKQNKGRVIRARRLTRKYIMDAVVAYKKRLKEAAKKTVEGNISRMVDSRINRVKIQNCVFMDGAIAFPYMILFGKENKLNQNELCALIIICALKQAVKRDVIKLGSGGDRFISALSALEQRGLIEKFGDYRSIYAPSITGRKLFLSFCKFYTEKITYQIHHEKGEKRRHNWPQIQHG